MPRTLVVHPVAGNSLFTAFMIDTLAYLVSLLKAPIDAGLESLKGFVTAIAFPPGGFAIAVLL